MSRVDAVGLNVPDGVLFDLGDTLLHTDHEDLVAGFRQQLMNCRNPRNVTVEQYVAAAEELVGDLSRRCNGALLEMEGRKFDRLLRDRFGLRHDGSEIDWERHFWESAYTMSPEPGIREVLSVLNEAGVPMGIVSNTAFAADTLKYELARQGLTEYFRFVMASADYGVRKPHPAIMRAALGRLDLPADRVWFVGDTPETDIAGARAVGMPAIWYNVKHGRCGGLTPDLEIVEWREFLPRLRQLLGQGGTNA